MKWPWKRKQPVTNITYYVTGRIVGTTEEIGRQLVDALRQYERRNGKGWRP